MVSQAFDVIVVGVGAMGSAACYQLARRGANVLGIEQFDIPQKGGTSQVHSQMIRQTYHEHPEYVPLLVRAYTLWRELQAEYGQRILFETGGLYLGPRDSDLLVRTRDAAEKYGVAHEHLGHSALAERFPMFRVPDSYEAIFEPRAGFLRPELAIAAHVLGALQHGAVLKAREKVCEWKIDAGNVMVRTDLDVYVGKQIVFCGGDWSQRLFRELGVPPVVTRQVAGWVWPKEPKRFAAGRFPVWMMARKDGSRHYGFPMLPDNPGFKVVHRSPACHIDLEQKFTATLPGDEAEIRWPITSFLPDAEGRLLALRSGFSTHTPEGHFFIDRHPHHPQVFLSCGFSGHAFKFSSVVAEILCDLIQMESNELADGILGLQRLARGPSSQENGIVVRHGARQIVTPFIDPQELYRPQPAATPYE